MVSCTVPATASHSITKVGGKGRLVIRAAAALTGLVPALTGCSSAGTHGQSCADQAHAWVHNGGLVPGDKVSRDAAVMYEDSSKALKAMLLGGDAGAGSPLTAWQGDAIALERDARAAASNPPPACARATEYVMAMNDYTTAAKDALSAISDFRSGNTTAGYALLGAGARALNRANSALKKIAGSRPLA